MDKFNSMKGRLTVKQEKFCLEYSKAGNAVQSYLKAYSKDNSYSATGVKKLYSQKKSYKMSL